MSKVSGDRQLKPAAVARDLKCFADAQLRINNAIRDKKRIVFVNEAVFTNVTLPTKAWAVKNRNTTITQEHLRVPKVYLLCAISREFGVEAFLLFRNQSTPSNSVK